MIKFANGRDVEIDDHSFRDVMTHIHKQWQWLSR